jgi:hypothetical protein
MRDMPKWPVSLLAALLLSACGTFAGAADPGPERSEDRAIDAATAVELATSGELFLSSGDQVSLRITAGENVLDHLTSEVRNSRLVLGDDGAVNDLGDVRYELVLPDTSAVELSGSGTVQVEATSALEELVLSGSGEVTVTGLGGDELAVELSGSGRISVDGEVTRQVVDIDGSGTYDGSGLSSEEAEVRIGGSGTADVTVENELRAVVEGSGTITYAGNPAVDSEIDGSGTVTPR